MSSELLSFILSLLGNSFILGSLICKFTLGLRKRLFIEFQMSGCLLHLISEAIYDFEVWSVIFGQRYFL